MSNDTTPDYQATLAGWWDEATPDTPIHPGDLVIHIEDGDCSIYEAQCEWGASKHARVLIPHTPPTPAWHDAVAVMASTEGDDIRRAFVPQYDIETGEERVDTWADWQGAYEADELIDPVPLIEARVTDAAERVRDYFRTAFKVGLPGDSSVASAIATAALGIGDDK